MDLGLPKYVRYDFLVTLIGIVFIVFAFYYKNIKPLKIDITLAYIIGIPLVIYGTGQMYNNYKMELELISLQSIEKRRELINQMRKVKLVTKKQKSSFHVFLK